MEPKLSTPKIIVLIIIAIVCLFYSVDALRVRPDEINACVKHSNMSVAQCEFELER